jgi:hypothetical protein
MSNKKIKAYVTKYALTSGILVVEAEHCTDIDPNMISFGEMNYAHGNNWHPTLKAALTRAEDMRQRKLATLRKQVARLEKLKIGVVDRLGYGRTENNPSLAPNEEPSLKESAP